MDKLRPTAASWLSSEAAMAEKPAVPAMRRAIAEKIDFRRVILNIVDKEVRKIKNFLPPHIGMEHNIFYMLYLLFIPGIGRVRIVDSEMQTATFLSFKSLSHNQISDIDYITQFA